MEDFWYGMEMEWKKIASMEYGKIIFHSIPYHALLNNRIIVIENRQKIFNYNYNYRLLKNFNYNYGKIVQLITILSIAFILLSSLVPMSNM